MGRGEPVARTVPSPHEEGKAMSDVEDGVREPAPPAKSKGRGAVVCCMAKLLGLALFVGALVIGILIWAKVLWFETPAVKYVPDGSKLTLSKDGLLVSQTFDVAVTFQVDNANKYPLKFRDVKLDVWDFQNNFLGTLTHPGTVVIPAKGNTRFSMASTMKTNKDQATAIGANCLANGLTTSVNARVKLMASVFSVEVPVRLGPYNRQIECTGIAMTTKGVAMMQTLKGGKQGS